MVSRKRDYALERQRRNERARALGYTSHDAMTRARRAGKSPAEQSAPKTRAPRIRSNREAREHDRRSKEWSDKHSKQDATRFNPRWSAARKEAYFKAFVEFYTVPNDERNFAPVYEYMVDWADHEPQEYDGDPYHD